MDYKDFRILSIYYEQKEIPWHELRDKHTVSAEFIDWAENKNDVQMVVNVINNKLESYNLIERIPRNIAIDQTSKITSEGEELYLLEALKRNVHPVKTVGIKKEQIVSEAHPTVFISYSWDDESHKNWVLNLANILRDNGINVLLDVYELRIGTNLTYFIENAIKNSDRIIIVFTPAYRLKADKREGGVGYEYSIINSSLYKDITSNEKVIPLLRSGDVNESISEFLQQYIYIDFSDDLNFTNNLSELLREIYKEPKYKKSTLGQKPDFDKIDSEYVVVDTFEKGKNIYVTFSDDTEKQITFSNSDSNPLLLPNENCIVFIRDTFGNYSHTDVRKIMKVNYHNLLEHKISDRKPYMDGSVNTDFICEITNPTLSVDQKSIIFLTEAYATSGNLVKVNLENGSWEIVSDAMDFELIKSGPHKNLFFVGKSQIKNRGRDVYYYLINEKNEILKEFNSKESYIEFRRSIQNKKM